MGKAPLLQPYSNYSLTILFDEDDIFGDNPMETFSWEPFREILCSDLMRLEGRQVENGQLLSFPIFELS